MKNHKTRGCIWWLGRGVLGLIGLILTLLLAGAVFQAVATAQDQQNYPPPGQMIDVNGQQFHIWCQGEGSPTVILESGLGDNSTIWAWVQPEIAQSNRVCSYDRAGLGWSDDSTSPRDSVTVAAELKALLDNAAIEGPYILVGHSLGGLFIRQFAYAYPNDVAGIVLVDSSHEEQLVRIPPDIVQRMEGMSTTFITVARSTSPLGFIRLTWSEDERLPVDARGAERAHLVKARTWRTVTAEFEATDVSTEQLQLVDTLGDIPLVVVTRGLVYSEYEGGLPGLSEELAEEMFLVWLELQEDFLTLSTNSTQLIAAESGHYVHLEQPEIVIEAIEHALDRASS